MAALAHSQAADTPLPFVAPTEILTGEPFLFTAGGQLSGVVIDIKTVEGEVVATKHTDKQGRVFLAAGLAAGSYVVSTHGSPRALGKVAVSGGVFDPFACDNEGLKIDQQTPPIDIGRLGMLHGNFRNPAALVFEDPSNAKSPQVRAATTSQVAFDRPADLGVAPGEHKIRLRDTAANQSAECAAVFYTAQARLTKTQVASGTETHLVVNLEPKQMEAQVVATIRSGPVSFTNGTEAQTLPLANGTADFALRSAPGSAGAFDVTWELKPQKFKWHLWEPKKWKSHLWTPPTQTEPAQPAKSGGDTKALEDDGWVKFVEGEGKDQRTGKKKIVRKGEGFEQEVKVYDDGKTSTMTTTRTGEKRKTVVTDTTTTTSEGRTEVVETMEYGKDEKGEWTRKSGKRETKKIVGGTESVSTETWSPKSGWK